MEYLPAGVCKSLAVVVLVSATDLARQLASERTVL